ncbi:MAG: hypothetical protein GXO58_02780 [Thermodesulfobacteria bacterium]|nr:hypothetical protein [Thermodesulfobacteriota bacterium]
MKISKLLVSGAMALFFVLSAIQPCQACVGRILKLALIQAPDQQVAGAILAVFINERTGTTVEIVPCNDIRECEEKIKSGDADLMIDYLAIAGMRVKGVESAKNDQEIYGLVKQYYLHNYSMVWLKPFGYHGPMAKDGSMTKIKPSLAVPVTTTRILDQFPVLDRVINKLSGRLDDDTMQKLIKDSKMGKDRSVIKKFLKDNHLI